MATTTGPRNEWTTKYLVKTANPADSDMAQRDYAAQQAEMRARQDVPEATVTVVSINRTKGGALNVEVLRKRWTATPEQEDSFAQLLDVELEAMANRAWREAVRCWAEYRGALKADAETRAMLENEALTASAWSDELQAAVIRRASDVADR